MPKDIRVNIRAALNTSKARETQLNGRSVMIVPSATLPDNIVMNGIKYPADEIEKSYKTLNRTPAPYGHPFVNGKYVSAFDPEGLNVGYIGAWNDNARREGGRVFLDKVIDIEIANQSPKGREVLEAINKGDPVHTSTGLVLELHEPEGDDHEYVARNMRFDHDAILLNEDGAATPEQGVGLLVNGQEVDVINSFIDYADEQIDWSLYHVVEAMDRKRKFALVEVLKEALAPLFSQSTEQNEDDEMSGQEDKKVQDQLSALSTKIDDLPNALSAAITKALEPVTNAITANANADKQRRVSGMVTEIVNAGQWTAEELADMDEDTISKIHGKIKVNKTAAGAPRSDGGDGQPKDDFEGYDLNAHFDKAS